MNSLFKDAFTIIFARGFIRLAQVVSFLVLARILAPEEFGWFGLVTTGVALAATLGSLGLRQSVAYQIGRGEMRPGEGIGTILATWPPLALLSGFLVFLAYGRDVPRLSPVFSAAAILMAVAAAMLITMLQGVFLGRGQISDFSRTETVPRALLAVFVVALMAICLLNIGSAVWSQSISFAIGACFAVSLAMRDSGKLAVKIGRLRPLIAYGFIFSANLFLITLCSRLSMFIIESESGPADAGIFFAAVRVNEIFLEVATALGLAVFSKTVRNTDDKSSLLATAKIACVVFWTFTVGAMAIAIGAPLVIRVMLGEQYVEAGDAMRVLCVGLGAAAANKVIYPAIAGQGRPLFGSIVIAASLAGNLMAALTLIPILGILGGAIALVFGQYLMFSGYILSCKRKFGISASAFVIPDRSITHRIRGEVRNVLGKINKRSK